MIGVNVIFDYHGDFNRSRVVAAGESERRAFVEVPGLRYHFFTYDEGRGQAANFSVWETKQAADTFFSRSTLNELAALYGVRPSIELVEVAYFVDSPRDPGDIVSEYWKLG